MTLTTTSQHSRNIDSAPENSTSNAGATKRIAQSECFWIAPEYRAALKAAGLGDFDSLMACAEGTLLRRRSDRENWRLELLTPDGETIPVFLKKHFLRGLRTRFLAAFRLPYSPTEGRLEAEFIRLFPAADIPTMTLVAYGERLQPDGRLESFVLTRELTGYVQLDDYLRQRRGTEPMTPHEIVSLTGAVAALAHRFHGRGYNHRDFYTCHFFVRETTARQWDLRLIDLQRVQRRSRFRRRWILKDLVQLAYSAPDHTIGCRERVRFLKAYLGVKKLRPADKRLIRRILWRERWMRWKLGNYG